jgi:oligoribonuclease NrnB/cAMP/cGMP phosphodiesterase (DHH superfamily)
MKTICIYHSRDLDGWMSAAIVKMWFDQQEVPNKGGEDNDELSFLGWDYGDDLPNLSGYDKIIMCDISFPSELMFAIHQSDRDFIWIDHHKSAIESVQAEGSLSVIPGEKIGEVKDELGILTYQGIRNSKYAACELTWKYFLPDEDMPEIVWYLGMYDSFRHKDTKHEQDVLMYQYAARALISDYEEALWYLEKWDDENLTPSMLQLGEGIYAYLKKEAKQIYSKKFDVMFDGMTFAAVNRERFNPINFGIDYHEDGYDGFACFWYDGRRWQWSLYSDNDQTDVSSIAKNRGGGGHFGAAGFRQDELFVWHK